MNLGGLNSMGQQFISGIQGVAITMIAVAVIFIALCKYGNIISQEIQDRWFSRAIGLLGVSVGIFCATGLAQLIQSLASQAF